MGMSEYGVGLSEARTPEQMGFVSQAFRAGEDKAKLRIIQLLKQEQELVTKLVADPNYITNLIEREYDAQANG
jgi:hypothetical protein